MSMHTDPYRDAQSAGAHSGNRPLGTGEADANRDPLSGEPGAHPVGTGAGAAAGGLAGAAIGAPAGPIGAAVGGAIGAVGGGLAGKAVAEQVDPTAEEQYWRGAYTDRPYVQPGAAYDDYAPAYRFGWESYGRYGSTYSTFDEADSKLSSEWASRGGERSTWDQMKGAVRDAWDRLAGRRGGSTPGRSAGSTGGSDRYTG